MLHRDAHQSLTLSVEHMSQATQRCGSAEVHLTTYQVFFYCIVHAPPIESPKKRVIVALVGWLSIRAWYSKKVHQEECTNERRKRVQRVCMSARSFDRQLGRLTKQVAACDDIAHG